MENNNLLIFLLAVVPTFLYLALIKSYANIPKSETDIKNIIKAVAIGFTSIIFLDFFSFILPHFSDMTNKSTITGLMMYCFFLVALKEELSKFGSYKIMADNKKLSKTTIIFYCIIPAASFSVHENIGYIETYFIGGNFEQLLEQNKWDLAILRNTSSVIVHLACGAIIGHYVANARDYQKKWKKYLLNIQGVFLASLLHAVYNFNLLLTKEMYKHHTALQEKYYCLLIVIFSVLLIKSIMDNAKLNEFMGK